ncbi:MAG: RNA polymerase sigma factor [Planctomycetaceae bacterium]
MTPTPDAQNPRDENTRNVPWPADWKRIQERLTVLLTQQGNREAFSRLVDLYDRRLLYFIRRILGATDGDLDVLQSVWLNVHRKLRKLKSPDAFRVWLYRIAHDQAVAEIRKKGKWPVLVDDVESLPVVNDANPDEAAFDNAELVHKALENLSFDHRRVLTLRFLEDMSINEIAMVVGQASGTVKSRLHYAKQALRRRIEELTDV